MYKYKLYTCLFGLLLLASCKRDVEMPNDIIEKTSSTVSIKLNNMFDSLNLQLDSVSYVLDNGEKIKINTYKYYLSNIKLIASDSSVYEELNSYHLINESSALSKSFTLSNVPFNNYTSIQFMIGVDSLHNVSGSQSGDLSPNYGMFWTWNTGYIQTKLEGYSQQSGASDKSVAFHIGGFKGINNALKTVKPSFNGAIAIVSKTSQPVININCNVKEWFINPSSISFSSVYSVSSVNATSKLLADNYADMFTIKSIQN